MSSDYTAAVATDGSLYTWGQPAVGRLGNGTEEWQEAPAPILTNVAEAYLGLGSMASATIKADGIKTDGSLWTWGYNGFKQLPGIEDDYLL